MLSNSTATTAATPIPDGRGSLAAVVSIHGYQVLSSNLESAEVLSAAAVR
jgi:hypothetical protein